MRSASRWRRTQLRRTWFRPGTLGDREPALANDLVDACEQIARAATPHGDGRDDRDAEFSRESVEVNLEAAVAGDIEHVER